MIVCGFISACDDGSVDVARQASQKGCALRERIALALARYAGERDQSDLCGTVWAGELLDESGELRIESIIDESVFGGRVKGDHDVLGFPAGAGGGGCEKQARQHRATCSPVRERR